MKRKRKTSFAQQLMSATTLSATKPNTETASTQPGPKKVAEATNN